MCFLFCCDGLWPFGCSRCSVLSFSIMHQTPRPGIIIKPSILMSFRLDALRVICSHEHFVALNLPLKTKSISDRPVSLTPVLGSQHFLISLLLHEVQLALASPYVFSFP